MTRNPDFCPRCKRRGTFDRDNRRCLNLDCLAALLLPGDDGHANQNEDWWMWMEKHLFQKPGWYRRSHFEERTLQENQQQDMQARALAQY